MSKIIKVSVVLEVEVPDDANWVSMDYRGTLSNWIDKPKQGGQVWCQQQGFNPPHNVEIKNWDQICFKV